MPSVLRLTVSEFTDRTQWRWTLSDAGGAFIADQQVRLNQGDWEYEAAEDLPKYISWHASPDERYAEDEARIVGDVGGWLGAEAFGDGIMAPLVQRRPATLQVTLPPGAEAPAFLPLELASQNGTSLDRSLRGVAI